LIGWWEGTEFRTVAGLLKDISRGGAAAFAETSPPRGAPIFLRLNGNRLTEWLEASVVEVSKNRWFRRVPRLIRMQFAEICPYPFFQAAIDVHVMDCDRGHVPMIRPGWKVPSSVKPRLRPRRHGRHSATAAWPKRRT
jgi:hypothetical protein